MTSDRTAGRPPDDLRQVADLDPRPRSEDRDVLLGQHGAGRDIAGGEQTAPLARSVIGGLIASTLTTLLLLPAIFAIVQSRAGTGSVSLDPEDQASEYFSPKPAAMSADGEGHAKSSITLEVAP